MRDHYVVNHEAGHQESCAHAVDLRFPEAEQVFEVLLRVDAFVIKLSVESSRGNRPVHDVVGALVADGEAPPAAFVLPPQTALDHDGSSGIHAPDDGSALIDEQRSHAVRNEADLVAVLLGKAAVQQVNLYELGTTDPDPCNRTRMLTFAFAGVVAAVVTYVIFLIIFLLDDRIKTDDENLERYLGLSVLGNIPNADGKKSGKYGYYKTYAAYRTSAKQEVEDK